MFKGFLKTIQNDILHAIFQVCRENIEKEIKAAEFVAVRTDETIDVSDKSQVIVTFRYVRDNKPVERFWSFLTLQILHQKHCSTYCMINLAL